MVRDADTQRRFNVAVSRARDQLWLPQRHSKRPGPTCLRYRLLKYCLNLPVHQPERGGETTLIDLRRMACNSSIRQSKKKGEKVPVEHHLTVGLKWMQFKILDRG